MSTVSAPRTRCKPRPDSALHATFATILPRIETHARIVFRNVSCPHLKSDRVADTVALAWQWFVRLDARGKDATLFPSALATLAALEGGLLLAQIQRDPEPLAAALDAMLKLIATLSTTSTSLNR